MSNNGLILTITVKNSYSYISKAFNGLSQDIQNEIIKQCSYYKRLKRFSHAEIYLLQKKASNQTFERYYQFPSGLVYRILKYLKAHNIKFKVNDERGERLRQIPVEQYYKYLKKVDPDLEERDYQKETIEKALRVGRGIISHSTSAGKTIVIGGITFCLNCRTLILCIGKNHVDQISKDITRYTGRRATIISSGICDTRGPVVVANVQALDAIKRKHFPKYKELIQSFRCIILDEVHHGGSRTYSEPFYYAIKAQHKYGFSGTVYREDGAVLEIIGAVGPILSKIDYDFLTKNNYISQARFMVIDPMCSTLYDEDDVWPECLQKGIVENEKRNNWIKSICKVYKKRKSQVLVITPLRTAHGKRLERIISDSVFLYGDSHDFHRREVIENFKNKKFNVLIGSSIFDEVVNLPDLRCILLAGGGKAHNATYQRIGRGIRKAIGKDFVDIIIPWDSHSSVLLSHSKQILRLIQKVKVWREHIHYIGKRRIQYGDF